MSEGQKIFHFPTSLEWTKEHQGIAHAPDKPGIPIACPPVFCKGSPNNMWTPEELFVSSLEVCVLLSFISQAKRNGVSFVSYKSKADSRLEYVGREFMFSEIVLDVHIEIPETQDPEQVRTALADSKKRCLISSSMKTEIKINADIKVAGG
ncbi:MAG: OsmC family protein [Candidatus Coatesbacteria bacterium]|nr:OsmC family protein [Candidatus Coatesbacteria bacterium]